MDSSWLEYCATEEQLRAFNDTGYLVVEDAISPEMTDALEKIADCIDAAERTKNGLGPHKLLSKFRTVIEDDLLLELLDNKKVFPLLWDILGWNIQLYISHLIMYPPEPSDAERIRKGAGWHQDGGRPIPEMERPHPRLSLKVSYWLSDVTHRDNGAMRLIPGSHKLDKIPPRSDPESDPDGAMDLLVKRGTAVLFDRRMWHSRGRNYSDVTRKVLFMGYSYRWLRGLDYNLMPEEILEKCDPIRRQLLGDGVDIKGWWQPTDADVPLKTWIAEHRGQEYV
ncbi:phytanoyl-CoA dioxygenase [Candidatus Poribacteria bacterium]|nr:phytanoyl-CoA dioxygenase [Candidatus Poribacteria bacterium]MYF55770.1 phytanoyl-CoA dioxygenase [Candidatus Poribacteria bacterium]MYI92970.1 phytanoyl-CoA dioxygenase [Candidatus Poribacteria bacterium]